jgi:hypothetical protein
VSEQAASPQDKCLETKLCAGIIPHLLHPQYVLESCRQIPTPGMPLHNSRIQYLISGLIAFHINCCEHLTKITGRRARGGGETLNFG